MMGSLKKVIKDLGLLPVALSHCLPQCQLLPQANRVAATAPGITCSHICIQRQEDVLCVCVCTFPWSELSHAYA